MTILPTCTHIISLSRTLRAWVVWTTIPLTPQLATIWQLIQMVLIASQTTTASISMVTPLLLSPTPLHVPLIPKSGLFLPKITDGASKIKAIPVPTCTCHQQTLPQVFLVLALPRLSGHQWKLPQKYQHLICSTSIWSLQTTKLPGTCNVSRAIVMLTLMDAMILRTWDLGKLSKLSRTLMPLSVLKLRMAGTWVQEIQTMQLDLLQLLDLGKNGKFSMWMVDGAYNQLLLVPSFQWEVVVHILFSKLQSVKAMKSSLQ